MCAVVGSSTDLARVTVEVLVLPFTCPDAQVLEHAPDEVAKCAPLPLAWAPPQALLGPPMEIRTRVCKPLTTPPLLAGGLRTQLLLSCGPDDEGLPAPWRCARGAAAFPVLGDSGRASPLLENLLRGSFGSIVRTSREHAELRRSPLRPMIESPHSSSASPLMCSSWMCSLSPSQTWMIEILDPPSGATLFSFRGLKPAGRRGRVRVHV